MYREHGVNFWPPKIPSAFFHEMRKPGGDKNKYACATYRFNRIDNKYHVKNYSYLKTKFTHKRIKKTLLYKHATVISNDILQN